MPNSSLTELNSSVAILRSRASSLMALQGLGLRQDNPEEVKVLTEDMRLTSIADEALLEVLNVFSDGGVPAAPPSLPSSPQVSSEGGSPGAKAADLKRLREVKEKFGNVTVVDKERVHDLQINVERATRCALRYRNKMVALQSELDEYKKSTSEKLESLMTSEVRDLLVRMWIEGGCVQKDTLNNSDLSEGMSFVRSEHSQLRDAVKGNLDEFAALISESMINVNSSLTTLENERNKLSEEVEQTQHELKKEKEEREKKEKEMEEEGNAVKEELANVSKSLQAANTDLVDAMNSLKLMEAREVENRRREQSDFVDELRGGFVLKKHCEGRQKIHYKSFTLSARAPHVFSWNDGGKTFPLADAVISLDTGEGNVFSMVSAEGQRLRLEAESALKAGIFVTKLQALIGR